VLTAVDRLLTLTDATFAIGDLELTVKNVLEAKLALVHPSWGSESLRLAEDLLDDGCGLVNHRRRAYRAAHSGRSRCGWLLDDTAGCTDENFSFTAGDLGFTLGDDGLAADEVLGAFGSKNTPDAFCVFRVVRRSADRRKTAGREGKHDGENSKDEREDEEKGRAGDGAVVVVRAA
jgi:hypothetical protein